MRVGRIPLDEGIADAARNTDVLERRFRTRTAHLGREHDVALRSHVAAARVAERPDPVDRVVDSRRALEVEGVVGRVVGADLGGEVELCDGLAVGRPVEADLVRVVVRDEEVALADVVRGRRVSHADVRERGLVGQRVRHPVAEA